MVDTLGTKYDTRLVIPDYAAEQDLNIALLGRIIKDSFRGAMHRIQKYDVNPICVRRVVLCPPVEQS